MHWPSGDVPHVRALLELGAGKGRFRKPLGNPWRLRLAVALSYKIYESPSTGRACLEFGVTDTSNGGVPPLDRDVLVY